MIRHGYTMRNSNDHSMSAYEDALGLGMRGTMGCKQQQNNNNIRQIALSKPSDRPCLYFLNRSLPKRKMMVYRSGKQETVPGTTSPWNQTCVRRFYIVLDQTYSKNWILQDGWGLESTNYIDLINHYECWSLCIHIDQQTQSPALRDAAAEASLILELDLHHTRGRLSRC